MKLENLLGLAIMLIGRYGGQKWHRFGSKGLETWEGCLLKIGFCLARLGAKQKSWKKQANVQVINTNM